MQIDAKQHQHSAAAAAKVILYQSAGELSLLVQYTTDLHLGRQLISKCLFGVFNFFQKNERKHVDLRYHSNKDEFVRLFFGRIVGLKKSLRLCLTFRNLV